jgi:hypothetical protein
MIATPLSDSVVSFSIASLSPAVFVFQTEIAETLLKRWFDDILARNCLRLEPC